MLFPPRFSKHGSLKSHEEHELPSELTEDWATMEVCVDCKKFISDIIATSKHSLSLATKRARLKRKTQSFYMSSPKDREEYRPSERTISEIWNPAAFRYHGTIAQLDEKIPVHVVYSSVRWSLMWPVLLDSVVLLLCLHHYVQSPTDNNYCGLFFCNNPLNLAENAWEMRQRGPTSLLSPDPEPTLLETISTRAEEDWCECGCGFTPPPKKKLKLQETQDLHRSHYDHVQKTTAGRQLTDSSHNSSTKTKFNSIKLVFIQS